jgi:hypothetical protein
VQEKAESTALPAAFTPKSTSFRCRFDRLGDPQALNRRNVRLAEGVMKIESTTFGAITIDGTTYQHDVVVRLSGEAVKRKKKLLVEANGR